MSAIAPNRISLDLRRSRTLLRALIPTLLLGLFGQVQASDLNDRYLDVFMFQVKGKSGETIQMPVYLPKEIDQAKPGSEKIKVLQYLNVGHQYHGFEDRKELKKEVNDLGVHHRCGARQLQDDHPLQCRCRHYIALS